MLVICGSFLSDPIARERSPNQQRSMSVYRETGTPFNLVKLLSIAICTSLFSAAEHKSVFGMLAAFSSNLLLLNVKQTAGSSSFFLSKPMR